MWWFGKPPTTSGCKLCKRAISTTSTGKWSRLTSFVRVTNLMFLAFEWKGVERMPNAQSAVEKNLHRLLIEQPLPSPVQVQVAEGRCHHDFFFAESKLAVEIDGNWRWHSAEENARRDANLIGTAVLRFPWDMPPKEMRERIANVMAETKRLPIAEKITWVRDYNRKIREARKPTKLATVANPLCLDCEGSGWRLMPYFSEFTRQAEMRATRCKCENLRTTFELWDISELQFRKPPVQETLPLQIKEAR